jgi:hypothetical protein
MFSSLRITPSCGWPTVHATTDVLGRATLQAEIGYEWLSQARGAWGAIH